MKIKSLAAIARQSRQKLKNNIWHDYGCTNEIENNRDCSLKIYSFYTWVHR